MLKLSEVEIIEKIQSQELFEGVILDESFFIKIESYTPAICTAIHAGGKLRKKLQANCALSVSERFYEEDPYTDQLIQAMPITLVALDSRYEYDLNRPLAKCIYDTAWGKRVWSKRLTPKEKSESVEKHQAFYRVLDVLTKTIEDKFGAALIFDIHSYNYLRHEKETPTFNLGCEQIDLDRWSYITDLTLNRLSEIQLPNMPVTVLTNSVFYGRGYMISHINSRFQNTLVLPIEVKKIFMDELSGDIYPLVMQALSRQFKACLVDISTFFSRRYTNSKRTRKKDMLTDKTEPSIMKLDQSLYRLAKGLETLHYINPINIAAERKRFFKNHGNYVPQFSYRQLDIDPYQFREQLYRLPVDSIRDPSIQSLYRDVIDSFSDKIDLLAKAGKPDFIYESLKYYGEPNQIDEQNARFLLHANSIKQSEEKLVGTEELLHMMKVAAKSWDMKCKVETSSKLVASAMVSNSKKTVLIAKNLCIKETDARALVNHELGVHMATTLNASQQTLKVFSLGLPGNTLTQEGLAILNEYQSGNMNLKRLKNLALRVLAVREMLKQGDFRHTYSFLVEEHHLSEKEAFKLAVRVHRGGGFTKDFLYLKGVSMALDLSKKRNIDNLYIGKTGFKYLPVIDEMVERKLVLPPAYLPEFLNNPVVAPAVLEYLMSCIKPSPCQSTIKLLNAI